MLDQTKIQAFRSLLDLVNAIWGSVFTRDLKVFFQSKLGPTYSDAQLAILDANYVDGLERQADAEARAAVAPE
jgi:hypothetical protein